jgi:hypothetical protein
MGGLKELHDGLESQVVDAIEGTHIQPQRLKELSVRLGIAVEPAEPESMSPLREVGR